MNLEDLQMLQALTAAAQLSSAQQHATQQQQVISDRWIGCEDFKIILSPSCDYFLLKYDAFEYFNFKSPIFLLTGCCSIC